MNDGKGGQPAMNKSGAKTKTVRIFTDEEQAAMREHAKEQKTAARRGSAPNREVGEREVLAKIAAMQPSDRAIGEKLHAVIKTAAPSLYPKLRYGMPAYANEQGNMICFFQDSQKFKTRYVTLGFSDKARIDDGSMWPTSFALMKLTATEKAKVGALVRKAVS
jgi:uncharacterized protein YdhG (YjbR/CyaY superfamily)